MSISNSSSAVKPGDNYVKAGSDLRKYYAYLLLTQLSVPSPQDLVSLPDYSSSGRELRSRNHPAIHIFIICFAF